MRKILYVVGRQAETNFLGGGEQLLQDSESFHSDVFTAPANTLTLTLLSASQFHNTGWHGAGIIVTGVSTYTACIY